jgi:hypothetical protein
MGASPSLGYESDVRCHISVHYVYDLRPWMVSRFFGRTCWLEGHARSHQNSYDVLHDHVRVLPLVAERTMDKKH